MCLFRAFTYGIQYTIRHFFPLLCVCVFLSLRVFDTVSVFCFLFFYAAINLFDE